MAFAVKQKQKIATRSGGHSYIGTSGAKGKLVLDLRRLEGAAGYDPATGLARVTPAATLYVVANVLGEQGRSIFVGTCATVGVAGLTLDGGLGVDSRQYGLESMARRGRASGVGKCEQWVRSPGWGHVLCSSRLSHRRRVGDHRSARWRDP